MLAREIADRVHSAGLAEIDHIIVDPYLRPADDTLLLEKPLQLAESWVACTSPGFDDVPIEGGLPLVKDGKVIGAVGTSGGSAQQDGVVAQSCVDTLGQ
jgi:hypothetical protein